MGRGWCLGEGDGYGCGNLEDYQSLCVSVCHRRGAIWGWDHPALGCEEKVLVMEELVVVKGLGLEHVGVEGRRKGYSLVLGAEISSKGI